VIQRFVQTNTPSIFDFASLSRIPPIDVTVARKGERKMKLLAIPGKVA